MMATAPQTVSLDAIAALLPIRNWESLLPPLVKLWREVSHSDASLIHVKSGDSSEVLTAWQCADGAPQFAIDAEPPPLTQFHHEFGWSSPDSRIELKLFSEEETVASAIPDDLLNITVALIDQAESMTSMQRRFEQDEAVRRWEKLESLAEFAAGAGHEINNPVATITGRAAQLLRDETDPDRRRSLATIGGQALRIRDMIGDVMLFARPPEPRPEMVVLSDVVGRVVEQLRETIEENGCKLRIDGDAELTLFADENQLEIVIANLLRNSLEAIETNVEIAIEWGHESPNEAQGLPLRGWFSVTDNGRGLTESERRHLFDPFFSGRQAGRGLGFGLCKCWRIVSNHGGRIDVESQPGRTRFLIVWPS